MNKTQEALKLALEALEKIGLRGWVERKEEAITAIREALADQCVCGEPDTPGTHRTDGPCLAEQPAQQQEPVAWEDEQGNVRMTLDAGEIQSSVGYVYSVHGERIKNACIRSDIPNGTPLYTSPPASKPWVGLTDEDTRKINQEVWGYVSADHTRMWSYARAIEAKLREKNA